MKDRLEKMLIRNTLPWAGTFHSFCARILRVDGKFLDIPPNYSIYDEGDQVATVKTAIAKLGLSLKNFKPQTVLNIISQAKNELLSALEYPQYAQGPWQETVAQIYLEYQKKLKESDSLDFDDLLFRTVQLFQKEKSILDKYQNRYHYVLVDEYQDTNHAQYVFTKLLAKKFSNLTVVGDAAQSIYGWRGADYRNLVNLKNDFPNLKIINLEENYRSTQTILEAANQVIAQNTSHPVLKLWTRKKGGEKISLYCAESETAEAQFVIYKISDSLSQWPDANLAVLYRTNAQSRIVEEALLRQGIPYTLIGGFRFYERKEIKDCLAYLRLINNPQDLLALKRLEKIGKGQLKKFQDFVADKKNQFDHFSSAQLLEKVLATTGYLGRLDENNPEDLSRIENIQELAVVAAQFPDLDLFLENVALIQKEYLAKNKSRLGSKAHQVSLMTVHAAKGREFDIVFIIGLEEGLFPHSRCLAEKGQIEEERRLCYVAMTRAKDKLYLTYSQNSLSRFVADIPVHLLEMIQ